MKKDNKNYILSIETTGKICGVCLACNNKILSEKNLDTGLTHSVTLFTNIDRILKDNKIKISDLSKIKVSSGPGSFTGIRIGIAAAISLAKPYNIKVEYIDTLDSLASNVIIDGLKYNDNLIKIIIPIMDAKVNRVFMSMYDCDTFKKYIDDSIYNINDLILYLNKYFINKNIRFIFSGDGCETYKDLIANDLKVNYKFTKNILQKSSSLIYTKGTVEKKVKINYMLKSKAERDKCGKD